MEVVTAPSCPTFKKTVITRSYVRGSWHRYEGSDRTLLIRGSWPYYERSKKLVITQFFIDSMAGSGSKAQRSAAARSACGA